MPSRPIYQRIHNRIQSDGFTGLIKRMIPFLHREYIRSYLPPTGTIRYNGIAVQHQRLGDTTLPWKIPVYPNKPRYEEAIVSGLRSHINTGDKIVVVGGGWGVSTTVAALEAGSTGQVTTYEGAKPKIKDLQKTVQLNNVSDRVSISHAIVGEKINLLGPAQDAEILSPKNLPNADVLVLDCEGAELKILDDLPMKPRVLIVEVHAFLGAPESEVRELLTKHGYEIVSKDIAEPTKQEFCEQNGIYVLNAVLK